MKKFFTWLRANRYKITLIAVTIALIYVFRWGWEVTPNLWWWQILLIFGTLLLEDCALFLSCEHLYTWWKRNPKLYNSELAGITWCHLFGFLILAVMTACFAWGNLWMFVGTLVLAFLLFWIAILTVILTHNSMFGDGNCKEW